MPRPPKYPLEPLLEHRDRTVDDATVGLGDAVRARETVAEARERAERARIEAERAAAETRAAEQSRLADGELRVADLARAEAWEVAVKKEMTELTGTVARVSSELDAARVTEEAARAELARTKADRDVVAKDKARFDDRTARAAEAAEEEEAGEAWRDRRGSR